MNLTELRQSLIDYLTDCGVHAQGAWDGADRLRHPGGLVTVGLKSLTCAPLTQGDYLGVRYVESADADCAVYVRRLDLVFALDLYVPADAPETALTLFDQLAEAVCLGGPAELSPGSLTCGALSYDSDADMLTCAAELAASAAVLLLQTEDGTAFTEFEVQGTMG